MNWNQLILLRQVSLLQREVLNENFFIITHLHWLSGLDHKFSQLTFLLLSYNFSSYQSITFLFLNSYVYVWVPEYNWTSESCFVKKNFPRHFSIVVFKKYRLWSANNYSILSFIFHIFRSRKYNVWIICPCLIHNHTNCFVLSSHSVSKIKYSKIFLLFRWT